MVKEERLCHNLIRFYLQHYPKTLSEHYQLDRGEANPEKIQTAIVQKRGSLKTKGEIDQPRVARLLLEKSEHFYNFLRIYLLKGEISRASRPRLRFTIVVP